MLMLLLILKSLVLFKGKFAHLKERLIEYFTEMLRDFRRGFVIKEKAV